MHICLFHYESPTKRLLNSSFNQLRAFSIEIYTERNEYVPFSPSSIINKTKRIQIFFVNSILRRNLGGKSYDNSKEQQLAGEGKQVREVAGKNSSRLSSTTSSLLLLLFVVFVALSSLINRPLLWQPRCARARIATHRDARPAAMPLRHHSPRSTVATDPRFYTSGGESARHLFPSSIPRVNTCCRFSLPLPPPPSSSSSSNASPGILIDRASPSPLPPPPHFAQVNNENK